MAKNPQETWQETMAIIESADGTTDSNYRLMAYSKERAAEARTLLTLAQITEFVDRLSGPEGCDFQEDGTWRCAGGTDQSAAIAILAAMGIDDAVAQGFLGCCTATGGHCDCEILMNSLRQIAPELAEPDEEAES